MSLTNVSNALIRPTDWKFIADRLRAVADLIEAESAGITVGIEYVDDPRAVRFTCGGNDSTSMGKLMKVYVPPHYDIGMMKQPSGM